MHQPVLLKEVLEYLNPKRNENYIDATFGFGGHAKEILKRIRPNGKLLGIEIDPEIYQLFLKKKEEIIDKKDLARLILINDTYVRIQEIAKENKFLSINGILFDLGVCSYHFDCSDRGFSYRSNQKLDMRFNPFLSNLTAYEIVNYFEGSKIEKILRDYGEEKFSKRIAQAIVKERKKKKIETTFDLIEILKRVLPKNYDNRRIHFATRTFQALRIATNNELENLRMALIKSFEILKASGKLVVVSFHSLEDRIVKNFFKDLQKANKAQILTKKPIRPSLKEIKNNPRSQSAKLRVIKKL